MTEFRVSRGECYATDAELDTWTAEKVMSWTLHDEGYKENHDQQAEERRE